MCDHYDHESCWRPLSPAAQEALAAGFESARACPEGVKRGSFVELADPLDGFGGAPAESLSLTTFADVPRTIRVAALDDPEGEPDDFIAIDLSETPTPREGLHFPPSDEFGYSL